MKRRQTYPRWDRTFEFGRARIVIKDPRFLSASPSRRYFASLWGQSSAKDTQFSMGVQFGLLLEQNSMQDQWNQEWIGGYDS